MEDSFKSLVTDLRKNRKKCPWSRDRKIEESVCELIDEANEVLESVKKKDNKNLKEELGDLLMDLIFVGIIAEEEKLFTINGMIKEVNKKLLRRKPWVFGKEKFASKKEAVKRWNEIKKLEKSIKQNETFKKMEY